MAYFAVPIAHHAAAPFDPNISSGTCFFAPGRPHTGPYIPCGNAGVSEGSSGGADGGRVLPCCVAGDYCQSSSACYSPDTGNVYIAGCTDPGYNSPACPYKSEVFGSQEWVGMVWSCGTSGSTGQTRGDGAQAPDGNLVDSVRNKAGVAATSRRDRSARRINSGNLTLTMNYGPNTTGSGHASQGHVHISSSIDADQMISWSGCPLPRPDSIVPERMYDMCDPCSPPRDGLFRDNRQLTRVAKLPNGIGGIVMWESGFGLGTPGGFGLGSGGGGGGGGIPSGSGIISLSASISSGTTTTMSSCVSTAGGDGDGVSAATGTGAAEGSGGGNLTHPAAASKMNIIAGSVSGFVIVLLVAALAWLLVKRHQRKSQEHRVVRETHLALARGPSPPQMVTSSSRAHGTGNLAPAQSLRVATAHDDGGYHRGGGGGGREGCDRIEASLTPTPSPLTTHVGSPGLLSPMGSVSRTRAPLRPDLIPETRRWSAATDYTATMESMTAQTTNTDHSSRTALTPASLLSFSPPFTTPLAAGRRYPSSPQSWDGAADDDGEFADFLTSAATLVRQKSVVGQNSLSPTSGSSIISPGSSKRRLSLAGDRIVEMENMTDRQLHAHAKQTQQQEKQLSVAGQDELSPAGRRRIRSVSSELVLQENVLEEDETATDGEEDSGSDDGRGDFGGDDGQSVVSYQGGTIQHIQQMRMRIIDPNTARVLILGKKGRGTEHRGVDRDGQDLAQAK